MSRPSMAAPPRNLSLTEELERLEQSITLTLQEIDHNFSRAHRIVTTAILPIVEQYGKHSEAVWEGSKFWKQFFEASANVSLSGYEAPGQDDTQHSHTYDDDTQEGLDETARSATPQTRPPSQADADDTMTLDSPSLGHSTPHGPPSTRRGKDLLAQDSDDDDDDDDDDDQPQFAPLSSPYETLRQEFEGALDSSKTPRLDPATPGMNRTLPDMGGFDSSPFHQPTTSNKSHMNQDPLLHRVLDKTYRVQATPLISPRKYKPTGAFTPSAARHGAPTPRGAVSRLPDWVEDSSPPSSPPPQLRADIFSPLKAPRTPGISVQTPAKGKTPMSMNRTGGLFDDSDDDEYELEISPPKTIQFHIPQSKLLQTPAREASKRIVEDLLMTAGKDFTNTTDGMEDDSPSVVRRQVDLDDSF